MTDDNGQSLNSRFEIAFNRLDRFLRDQQGLGREVGFVKVVREFDDGNRWWSHRDFIISCANLRNVLIHERTGSHLAHPTSGAVAQLEKICAQLIDRRVFPTFKRKVETIQVDDSLLSVLKIIRTRNYSQFPVYHEKQLRGLLTENGITRWLAEHGTTKMEIVDLQDTCIRDVLREEEVKKTFQVVAAGTTVTQVRSLFAEHALIEAALITQSGARTEPLMGIITRCDLLQ